MRHHDVTDFSYAPAPLDYPRESLFNVRNLLLIAGALAGGVAIGHSVVRVFA